MNQNWQKHIPTLCGLARTASAAKAAGDWETFEQAVGWLKWSASMIARLRWGLRIA